MILLQTIIQEGRPRQPALLNFAKPRQSVGAFFYAKILLDTLQITPYICINATPMSYNRKNLLRRMIDIQNIVLAHTGRGVNQEWVFENEIQPVYHISRRTFYSYLRTNAKAELKKLKQVEEMQTSLF